MRKYLEETIVGECYRNGCHYYMQREDDVLHVNTKNPLINNLDFNHLNDYKLAMIYPISLSEFNEVLDEIIKKLKINYVLNRQT